MKVIELYNNKRDKLSKKILTCSGFSVLLAAGSQLPTWEVKSPVGWITGTLNVGYLPIFGPAVVFGLFCNVIISMEELRALRHAIIQKPWPATDNIPTWVIAELTRPPHGFIKEISPIYSVRIANATKKVWALLVPVVAFAILVGAFFDFVRPDEDNAQVWRFESRTMQVVDLLIGAGGWGGFKPLAPSIQDNLHRLSDKARVRSLIGSSQPGKLASISDEEQRLLLLADAIPWIYPPVQTWAYLTGLALMILMAWSQRHDETHFPVAPTTMERPVQPD